MTRHVTTRTPAALLAALSVGLGLSARAAATPSDTLGAATVVTYRLPASMTSALPVQRLDTLALRRRGVTDIGDALRRFAGVNLRDYGGAGGLKSVSVRGLGASHTVVSYDGLPVSDAQTGQTDMSRFSTDRLAGIGLEVADAAPLLSPVRQLSAAQVVLWSAQPDTATTRTSAALRHGSFGTVNPAFSLSTPLSRHTALSVGGDFYYGRNDYPFTVENGVATTRERRRNSRMQAWNGEANLFSSLKNGTWLSKVSYYNNHRRLPGLVTLYTNESHERLQEQAALAQTMWRQRFGQWTLMAGGKFNFQESRYTDLSGEYPDGRLEQDYWQREWYATAGAACQLGHVGLSYAIDYDRQALNSNLATDNDAVRHSVLQALAARYALGPLTLTARLAAHLHYNRRHDATAARNARRLTPMVSAAWTAVRTERVQLGARAFWQELFRMPTFTETYYYHLGSQDLRPELTRQLGGGLTLLVTDAAAWWPVLSLTADGYYNRVTDRITSVPYSLYVWRTVNLGKVIAKGLDVTLESHFRPATRHELVVAANYSLQRANDYSSEASANYGKQLAYTPLHSGAVSVAWENPWCNVVAHTTYASSRWSNNEHLATTGLPGYAETGFGLYRTFALRHAALEVRADLLNAFDKAYAVIRRYPMPGRAYKLGLKLSW